MRTVRTRPLLVITAILMLLVSGCAQRSEEADVPPKDGGFPVKVDSDGRALNIKAEPKRIVSLGPTGTEDLFSIGAGQQVVAADSLSNYPKNAPREELSSYQPNVEAIAEYKPDLVVATNDMNGLSDKLAKLGIPLLLTKAPKDLNGVYAQLRTLGKATGHEREAANAVNGMRKQIEDIVEDTPKPKKPLSYFYETDSALYTATSKTFIGGVFGMFGMRNIADDADRSGSGYPKLSAEQVLRTNPDLIFTSDEQGGEELAKRPGWSTLGAVRGNRVTALNPDIASRWTPRIVEMVRAVSNAVTEAEKSGK